MSVRGEAGDARSEDYALIRAALQATYSGDEGTQSYLLPPELQLPALAALDRLQADPGEPAKELMSVEEYADYIRTGRRFDKHLPTSEDADEAVLLLIAEGTLSERDVGGLQGRPCAGEQPADEWFLCSLCNCDETWREPNCPRGPLPEAVAGAGTSAQPALLAPIHGFSNSTNEDSGAGTARPAQENQAETEVATGDDSPGALARTLSKARERLCYTLRAVELATGVHNAHISQVERGVIEKPSLDVLAPLAAFYGLNLSLLASWAGYSEDVVRLLSRAQVGQP